MNAQHEPTQSTTHTPQMALVPAGASATNAVPGDTEAQGSATLAFKAWPDFPYGGADPDFPGHERSRRPSRVAALTRQVLGRRAAS